MTTTLEESARLAGSHVWLERRLFEILGAWVPTTPEPDAKLLFDRHSSHHAWRAQQWFDRLPFLADVDRETLAVPPGPAPARPPTDPPDRHDPVGPDRPAGLDGTAARLAGAYRFALPRLWSGYERHRTAAGATADGSSLRTLGLVIPDVTSDWQEGEALLQHLLVDRDVISAASAAVAALESALLE